MFNKRKTRFFVTASKRRIIIRAKPESRLGTMTIGKLAEELIKMERQEKLKNNRDIEMLTNRFTRHFKKRLCTIIDRQVIGNCQHKWLISVGDSDESSRNWSTNLKSVIFELGKMKPEVKIAMISEIEEEIQKIEHNILFMQKTIEEYSKFKYFTEYPATSGFLRHEGVTNQVSLLSACLDIVKEKLKNIKN